MQYLAENGWEWTTIETLWAASCGSADALALCLTYLPQPVQWKALMVTVLRMRSQDCISMCYNQGYDRFRLDEAQSDSEWHPVTLAIRDALRLPKEGGRPLLPCLQLAVQKRGLLKIGHLRTEFAAMGEKSCCAMC